VLILYLRGGLGFLGVFFLFWLGVGMSVVLVVLSFFFFLYWCGLLFFCCCFFFFFFFFYSSFWFSFVVFVLFWLKRRCMVLSFFCEFYVWCVEFIVVL